MNFELEPPAPLKQGKAKLRERKEYIKSYLSNAQAIDQAITRLKEVALLLELEPGPLEGLRKELNAANIRRYNKQRTKKYATSIS